MKTYGFALILLITGCSAAPTVSKKSERPDVVVIKEVPTPQLWTGHKELTGSVDSCAFKAESILNMLGFTDIVKSVYETETYLYANFINNRAGIHCTSVGGKIFVYGSVAGADVKTVEILRNNIFTKF